MTKKEETRHDEQFSIEESNEAVKAIEAKNYTNSLYDTISKAVIQLIQHDPSFQKIINDNVKQMIEAMLRDKMSYRSDIGKAISEKMFGVDNVFNCFDGLAPVAHTMTKMAVSVVDKYVLDISKDKLEKEIHKVLSPLVEKEIDLQDILTELIKDLCKDGEKIAQSDENIIVVEIIENESKHLSHLFNSLSIKIYTDIDTYHGKNKHNHYLDSKMKPDITMRLTGDLNSDLYSIVNVCYKNEFNGSEFMPYALYGFSRYLFNVYAMNKTIKIQSKNPDDYDLTIENIDFD